MKNDKDDLKEKQLLKNDSIGLTQTQIINLTTKIHNLQLHFTQHIKDLHSKRGLLKQINLRKKLLNYLKKKSVIEYFSLIQQLHIRK